MSAEVESRIRCLSAELACTADPNSGARLPGARVSRRSINAAASRQGTQARPRAAIDGENGVVTVRGHRELAPSNRLYAGTVRHSKTRIAAGIPPGSFRNSASRLPTLGVLG